MTSPRWGLMWTFGLIKFIFQLWRDLFRNAPKFINQDKNWTKNCQFFREIPDIKQLRTHQRKARVSINLGDFALTSKGYRLGISVRLEFQLYRGDSAPSKNEHEKCPHSILFSYFSLFVSFLPFSRLKDLLEKTFHLH